MNLPRRTFLKGIFATGGAMALGTTVLPQNVMADWQTAVEAESVTEAEKALFEGAEITEITDENVIAIKLPEIAENGQVVPIEVTTNLDKLESITILAEKNTVPLVAQFNFPDPEKTVGWVKTRIKIAKTSNVVAVVKAKGQLYAARRELTVTLGGCGG
ncbi:MAG: thiosulfate oxidation carrier protein SoxY [Candidatus Parabeggiatoa sp.]|nr:thiosulfate oxidation carrier protein SoxY [Candidatus Parabeggiatoa sp.]